VIWIGVASLMVPRLSSPAPMKILSFAVLTLVIATHAVRGVNVPFSYSFTASNLEGPAPTISGSFSGFYTPGIGVGYNNVWLSSLNLNIAGFEHTVAGSTITMYSFGDASGFASAISVYGTPSLWNLHPNSDDYILEFLTFKDGRAPVMIQFGYRTPSVSFYDEFVNKGTYRVTAAAVPDSGSSIVLAAIMGLVIGSALQVSRKHAR
jgi:hypothetical protein